MSPWASGRMEDHHCSSMPEKGFSPTLNCANGLPAKALSEFWAKGFWAERVLGERVLHKGVLCKHVLAERICREGVEAPKRIASGRRAVAGTESTHASIFGVIAPGLPVFTLGLGPVVDHRFIPVISICTHNWRSRWFMAVAFGSPSTGFCRICAMHQKKLPCILVQCNKAQSTPPDTTEKDRGEAGILVSLSFLAFARARPSNRRNS